MLRLQVTTRSWLGAVVHHTGGLVIDHRWLRVLGSGNTEHRLRSLGDEQSLTGGLVVAQDVLGGQFAWTSTATIHYLAPDTLEWEDTELGYGAWLAAMLGGALTGFAENLRWPGWPAEVEACHLDQALSLWPPPWTSEGENLAAVSRRPIPMSEEMSLNTSD